MEQRRFILFIALSFGILFVWTTLVVPRFAPPKKPQPANQAEAPLADDPAEQLAEAEGGDADDEQASRDEQAGTDAPVEVADGDPAEPLQNDDAKPETHEPQTVRLGSPDPDSGFFLNVEVDSRGASVSSVELNDPRYKELKDPQSPVEVVGPPAGDLATLASSVDVIDEQLERFLTSLADVHWQLTEVETDPALPAVNTSATFRYVAPDKSLAVEKKFWLEKVALSESNPRETRDTSPAGYQVHLDLTLTNLGNSPRLVQYTLQGPVRVPLENAEHTRKLRDIKVGFLQEDGGVNEESMSASTVADEDLEIWKQAIRYVGVDVQFFAALLIPLDGRPVAEQLDDPWIEAIGQVLVTADANEKSHSDISVILTSKELGLDPAGKLTHSYALYAGPKRQALLEPLGAEAVLDYGFFGPVAKVMLGLLTTMHDNAGIPYGIAIILMTVMVRGCMVPLSLKQARGAKKMKELQPKIAELKKKYEKDKEKFARAQMELFSKEGYNPLAGCLPIFLQLPIFIGLYTALNAAVDLRLAPFLWFDNLAAPDALFKMPALPFLGSDFNLLPLVTVVLFVVQQKMFMPPPADEQQEMQQKMMMYMSIFMGFLFWHFPAGLCVYFIASSLWGLGERKMIDLVPFGGSKPPEKPDEGDTAEKKSDKAKPEKEAATGWWGRLLESADAAANNAGAAGQGKIAKQVNGAKGKRKKTRSRR